MSEPTKEMREAVGEYIEALPFEKAAIVAAATARVDIDIVKTAGFTRFLKKNANEIINRKFIAQLREVINSVEDECKA